MTTYAFFCQFRQANELFCEQTRRLRYTTNVPSLIGLRCRTTSALPAGVVRRSGLFLPSLSDAIYSCRTHKTRREHMLLSYRLHQSDARRLGDSECLSWQPQHLDDERRWYHNAVVHVNGSSLSFALAEYGTHLHILATLPYRLSVNDFFVQLEDHVLLARTQSRRHRRMVE